MHNLDNTYEWFQYQFKDYLDQYTTILAGFHWKRLQRKDTIVLLDKLQSLHTSLESLVEEIELSMGGRPDSPALEIDLVNFPRYNVWADVICLGTRIEALMRVIDWIFNNGLEK